VNTKEAEQDLSSEVKAIETIRTRIEAVKQNVATLTEIILDHESEGIDGLSSEERDTLLGLHQECREAV
jgi:hypothetical protein